jgi:uncharacterized protein (TIGR02246 family)
MRSPWIISIIAAIGLSVGSASAQQVDQSMRQQIERFKATFAENYKKHDAAGIARLYTRDGVLVTPGGVMTGQKEIEQHYAQLFILGINEKTTVNQFSPLGTNAAIAIGEYYATGQGKNGPIKAGGRWTAVYVREGGIWKARLVTAVPFNSLAAVSGGTAASSGSSR